MLQHGGAGELSRRGRDDVYCVSSQPDHNRVAAMRSLCVVSGLLRIGLSQVLPGLSDSHCCAGTTKTDQGHPTEDLFRLRLYVEMEY